MSNMVDAKLRKHRDDIQVGIEIMFSNKTILLGAAYSIPVYQYIM
jgi:hypothetical protein